MKWQHSVEYNIFFSLNVKNKVSITSFIRQSWTGWTRTQGKPYPESTEPQIQKIIWFGTNDLTRCWCAWGQPQQAQRRREVLFQVPALNTHAFVNELMFSCTYFGGLLLLLPGDTIVRHQYNFVIYICVSVVCACVFIHTPHIHGANRSHSQPLSTVQSEHSVKLKSWVFTEEKRKQKQPLCFFPTEGLCLFQDGTQTSSVSCWCTGRCNPWVPLAMSPAGLLLIPFAVNLCSLTHMTCLCLTSFSGIQRRLFAGRGGRDQEI